MNKIIEGQLKLKGDDWVMNVQLAEEEYEKLKDENYTGKIKFVRVKKDLSTLDMIVDVAEVASFQTASPPL